MRAARLVVRPAVGAALAALLVFGCDGQPSSPSDDPGPGDPGTGRAVVVDGIEYHAEVQVMESFPVQLAGVATVVNRDDDPRTVTFPDGCVALLRAYPGSEGEPAWDQAAEVACTEALVPVALAPGESREFRTPTASAYDVLGDEHPDGDYRIAVYLRPGGEEVEAVAGTVALAIPRGDRRP